MFIIVIPEITKLSWMLSKIVVSVMKKQYVHDQAIYGFLDSFEGKTIDELGERNLDLYDAKNIKGIIKSFRK